MEALAENLLPFEGIAAPVLDARRDQVYSALFACEDGRLVRLTEDRVMLLPELLSELQEKYPTCPIFFPGDAHEKAKARAKEAGLCAPDLAEEKRLPSGAAVARLGYRVYLDGGCVSGEELAPVYLRLPQAERERLERENKKAEDK